MAEVTWLGPNTVVFDKRVGKERVIGPTTLSKGPPTFKCRYGISANVSFQVDDVDDLGKFVDMVRGGRWKVKVGKKELAKVRDIVNRNKLEVSATGIITDPNAN